MKKESLIFWIKSLVLILLLLLTDLLAGVLFPKLQNIALEKSPYAMVSEYTMWKVDKELILIGASETTHGFVPLILEDSLKLTVHNCGKDGYRFYYQSAMINGILKRYSPKIIIWSVSANFLSSPTKDDIDRLKILNTLCVNNDYIKSILKSKGPYEKFQILSNLYLYNSKLIPYLYKSFASDYNFEPGGFIPLSNNDNKYPKKQYSIIENNLDERIVNSFIHTIKLCNKSQTKLIIVFPPRLQISNYKETVQYKELIKITEKYNIHIIEKYYNDKIFMDNPLYFKDIGHLNKLGAYKFTSLVSRDINLIMKNN